MEADRMPLETTQNGETAVPAGSISWSVQQAQVRGLREGYRDGLTAGCAAALHDAQAEEERLRAAQARECTQLDEANKAALARLRAQQPARAVALTERILCAALAAGDEAFCSLFRQAAAHVRRAEQAVLHASPHDCEIAARHMDALKNTVDGLEELELRPVQGAEDGFCVLETEAGSVDVGVQTQLAKALRIAGMDQKKGKGETDAAQTGH